MGGGEGGVPTLMRKARRKAHWDHRNAAPKSGNVRVTVLTAEIGDGRDDRVLKGLESFPDSAIMIPLMSPDALNDCAVVVGYRVCANRQGRTEGGELAEAAAAAGFRDARLRHGAVPDLGENQDRQGRGKGGGDAP